MLQRSDVDHLRGRFERNRAFAELQRHATSILDPIGTLALWEQVRRPPVLFTGVGAAQPETLGETRTATTLAVNSKKDRPLSRAARYTTS